MNTRLSTSMMYHQSVSTMLSGQGKIAHLRQQLSTGQRLVTAKDDPVAAGSAIGLERSLATLEQYGKNAGLAQSRISMQENTLAEAGELMARVKELMVKANDGMIALADRQVIAVELGNIRESLLGLANATDGNGRYLFAGTADDSAPFANANGQVSYHGDQVQRRIDIAPDLAVTDTLPGSEVFMRIRTGDGSVDARADADNTGTGVVLDFGRSGSAGAFDGGQYRVRFGQAQQYQVLDDKDNVIHEGTHAAGEEIAFAGLRLKIAGTPAAGDEFAIGAAGTEDVFSSLDRMIATLNRPTVSDAGRAQVSNQLQAGLRTVDRISDHFISARAASGAQLAMIETAAHWREANHVGLKSDISAINDLDYVAAISEHELEKIVLQAAQSVFMKMQGMSLFAAGR